MSQTPRATNVSSIPTFCFVSSVCSWNSCFSILDRSLSHAQSDINLLRKKKKKPFVLMLLTSHWERIYFLFTVGSPIDVQNHVEALKIVELQNVCFVNWIKAAISKSMRRYICSVCIRLLNERKQYLSNFFESWNLAFQQKILSPIHLIHQIK